MHKNDGRVWIKKREKQHVLPFVFGHGASWKFDDDMYLTVMFLIWCLFFHECSPVQMWQDTRSAIVDNRVF